MQLIDRKKYRVQLKRNIGDKQRKMQRLDKKYKEDRQRDKQRVDTDKNRRQIEINIEDRQR